MLIFFVKMPKSVSENKDILDRFASFRGSISLTGDDVLFINNSEFENYLTRPILLSLRSRKPQIAPLLLLSYIYYCRFGEMVDLTLPFMTN